MKTRLGRYFSSWWTPMAATVLLLGSLLAQDAVGNFPYLDIAIVVLLIASLISVLGFGINMLASKYFTRGLVSIIFFMMAATASYLLGFSSIVTFMFFIDSISQEKDTFGKDIEVPEDMAIEWPSRWFALPDQVAANLAKDAEGIELLAGFTDRTAAGSGSRQISVDLPVLNSFVGADRGLLLRHLATSAKWRVGERRGQVYAHRRFVTYGGRWQNSLSGYYTEHDFDAWGRIYFQYFQVRIIVGPDGPVMSWPWTDELTDAAIGAGSVTLRSNQSINDGYESYLVLRSDGPALEIYEEAKTRSRSFTANALERVEAELTALWHSDVARTSGFDPELMPPESINRGNPEIDLVHGSQGGIYVVYAYVNPGEDGFVYLKAYEATTDTRLSPVRISERSTEYVGWSDDPDEVFFYNTQITVYEGSWEVYYPARFELWFVPASGGPERKLVEKIFMVEGWQR